LRRLMARRPDLLEAVDDAWPEQLVAEAVAAANAIATEPPALDEAMRVLRRAKDAVHLAVALADLARAWPLDQVTGVLTQFADAALRAAVALGANESARRGDLTLAPFSGEESPVPGFALIALGKMGARELNYSSDI